MKGAGSGSKLGPEEVARRRDERARARVRRDIAKAQEPSHVEWQAQVVDLMHGLGYEHLHVRRTVGRGKKWVTSTNLKGFPDLFAWHPRLGFVAVELKVGRDVASPEQLSVLTSLRAAGARTMVAYPHDLTALVALLRDRA